MSELDTSLIETVNTTRQPFLVLDAALSVCYANPAFFELFRCSAADTLGRSLFMLGHGQWDDPSLRQHNEVRGFPLERRFAELGPKHLLLNARRLPGRDGYSDKILLAIEDVTEQERLQNELIARNEFNEWIKEQIPEVRYEYRFQRADGAQRWMEGRAILTYAGNGTPLRMLGINLDVTDRKQAEAALREREQRVREFDLNTVVKSACAMLQSRAQRSGIRLELDLAADLPAVMGVRIHLEHVLINLTHNAIEAIDEAGMPQSCILIETRREQTQAHVVIRDNGPGIGTDTVEHLFEPFSSGKREGLGMGLRISRSLIEAMHGRLWVEPQTPGGIFHFTLSFYPMTATVFIVDDDTAMRDSLEQLRVRHGFEVQAYADGAAFLADCGEDSAGCVLLDSAMPGLSGQEVQAALNERGLKIRSSL